MSERVTSTIAQPTNPFTDNSTMSLFVGAAGRTRHACIAVSSASDVLGICEQERITRVKAAGFNSTGFADEALGEILRRSNHRTDEITRVTVAESGARFGGADLRMVDHGYAHACASFLTSPFASATIVIIDDDEQPELTVWRGNGSEISRVDYPWSGPCFATLYSKCADAVGFRGPGQEQRLEALARLTPLRRQPGSDQLLTFQGDRLCIPEDWQSKVQTWASGGDQNRIRTAASIQCHFGDLLLELIDALRRVTESDEFLCLGGTLFSNSFFNSRIKTSGIFGNVFVPINPGNAGLAVGMALESSGPRRQAVSSFLGPRFSSEEVKATLDNCKLEYSWASDVELVETAVKHLVDGRLVGWFEGGMEWGPRALGARSIIANPFSPYVLDNLNRFLKQRDPWRGYALSGLAASVHEEFTGPSSAFMECDFNPRDRHRFRYILPGPEAGVRMHTVEPGGPSRFQLLLRAFGDATGLPILVNTSFNGFQEPIVCSPRDAVRVFFGTGLDALVLEDFILEK